KMWGVIRSSVAYPIRGSSAIGFFPRGFAMMMITKRWAMRLLRGLGLFAGLVVLSGCGSVHLGWPGVPVSVGVPLRGLAKPIPLTLSLAVETDPPGAEVHLNGRFVGTSPTVVHAVFKRSFTGQCLAEPVHRLLVTKLGYRPMGLSYTCQLAWDRSDGTARERHLTERVRLEPEW
ncbi:MAG: PEGA domain-containing protein, partial [Acidobacteriota bacterium]